MIFTEPFLRDIAATCNAPTGDPVLDGLFDAYNEAGPAVEDAAVYYRFLYQLSRRIGGLRMVELGCKYGAASLHFLRGGGAAALAIDCGDRVRHDLFAETDFTFLHRRSADGAAVEVGQRFAPDLILVDSSHALHETREEIRLWTPVLKPGGLMLLDDVQAEEHFGRADFGCGTAFKEMPGHFYLNELHPGGWGFGCWLKPNA